MTLEGLLAFAGLVIAVLAIVDPVRQRAFVLLVPWWLLLASFVASWVLIWLPRIVGLFGCELLPWSEFAADLGAFVLPLGGLAVSWLRYKKPNLQGARDGAVASLVDASVLENRFDEVRRILERNRDRLKDLPQQDLERLFDRRLVHQVMSLRSFIHLELLSDMALLESLPNRYNIVDGVVRELIGTPDSPLRNAVLDKYPGDELARYSTDDQILIERTFQKPEWYVAANAHYPLLMQAIECLWSGDLDARYNSADRLYVADQGVSSRSQCPIYLGEKTITLAILRSVEMNVDEDVYVTDLFHLYQAILARSRYDETVWASDLANPTTPTPYSYLLREISNDFEEISRRCLATAVDNANNGSVPVAPYQVVHQLSNSWRLSMIELARSNDRVSDGFKLDDIKRYLNFLLQIRLAVDRYTPAELLYGTGGAVDLEAWWNLFLEPWKRLDVSTERVREVFEEAFVHLDSGKDWVSHGKGQLHSELGL